MRHPIPAAAIALLTVLSLRAQPPEFDAVSIKPSIQNKNGPVTFEPGRAFSKSVTAHRIIMAAYRLKEYQLVGVKDWIGTDWFALDARAAKPADESQLRQMLQTLLSKRFRLVMHRETRATPVYAIIQSRNGTKLRPWSEGDPVPRGYSHESIESLVNLMNLPGFQKVSGVDRPVIDKTGLKGDYLVQNSWYDSWEDFSGSIVEDRMGLKVESQKVPMDVLVIDHIEKPDPN